MHLNALPKCFEFMHNDTSGVPSILTYRKTDKWDVSESCVDGDRVITGSAFHLGNVSVRLCKIQGKIATFMPDTSNLDYLYHPNWFVSVFGFFLPLFCWHRLCWVAGEHKLTNSSGMSSRMSGQLFYGSEWYWSSDVWVFFQSHYQCTFCVSDSALQIRSSVLCLLLK